MENYTNRLITEERNNMGMVRYCVVDRTNTPNAFCGGSFNTKEQGIEQLKRAKHLYPNHKWTLEAVFSIGGKEKKRKNLGDPLVRLTESDLHRIIRESIDRALNEEGVYGYPDTVDMIILDTECDRELWLGYYEPLVKALVKKANKGVELSKERLANSSIMKKFQQAAFRKFAYDQDNLDRANSPRIFREYMADKMLNSLEDYGYNPNNLNEGFDGYDNDLDYETVYDEALNYINMNPNATQSWRAIAKGIGFRMETIGPNDMETLKDAIEDAMTEDYINEAVARSIRKALMEEDNKGIEINPENKGKFNATKKRTGKSTEELTHSKNPLTRKRAVFAMNAKKWNKD